MSEWLTQAVTFAATAIVAYHAIGWVRTRMARDGKAYGAAQERTLVQMLALDQPNSRSATLSRGRELLDQHQHDQGVGLVVIAIEPDGLTTWHASMSVDDALKAANSILGWAAERGHGALAQRAKNAARATGVKSVSI